MGMGLGVPERLLELQALDERGELGSEVPVSYAVCYAGS